LWSWCVSHGPTLPAFQEVAPFTIAVVELAEDPGVRMIGNIVSGAGLPLGSVDPETLSIGMKLAIEFARVCDDVVLPYWTPAGG